MPAPTDYSAFFLALDASELPWCVTGSVASGIYGEPRMTIDIDFVLLLHAADIPKLRSVFPEDRFYIPPTEMLLTEITRSDAGMFNLIHHDGMLKADIFLVKNDPLHRWALEHRRRGEMKTGVQVWISPPEYVLIRKLESYRDGGSAKHLRDIRFMLACTEVDRRFIKANVERLGLREQWAESQLPERS